MTVAELKDFLSLYDDNVKIKIKNQTKLEDIFAVEEYWDIKANIIELIIISTKNKEDNNAK